MCSPAQSSSLYYTLQVLLCMPLQKLLNVRRSFLFHFTICVWSGYFLCVVWPAFNCQNGRNFFFLHVSYIILYLHTKNSLLNIVYSLFIFLLTFLQMCVVVCFLLFVYLLLLLFLYRFTYLLIYHPFLYQALLFYLTLHASSTLFSVYLLFYISLEARSLARIVCCCCGRK
jgi:hypothetical protein